MTGDTLNQGDWVRTKDGHSGKILLVARMSAFIDIRGNDELRAKPYLLSELKKIEPPTDDVPRKRTRSKE
jgi:hypothetical protein